MSTEEQGGLQRLRVPDQLPAGFEKLPSEDQKRLLERHLSGQLDAIGIAMRGKAQSAVAENDLRVAIDTVQSLDAERKVYTHTQTAKFGSGDAKLTVRGGDTRFIVPILIVIGVTVVALIALFIR